MKKGEGRRRVVEGMKKNNKGIREEQKEGKRVMGLLDQLREVQKEKNKLK